MIDPRTPFDSVPEAFDRWRPRYCDELFNCVAASAALVDAPCSNSGVLARRPDARWRWSADEVERLSAVQLSILRNVARLGAGRIVYSTCSIDRAENEGVVSAFTENAASGYVVEKSRTWLPIADPPDFDRFLPPTWHDGAFAALLRRV